VRASLETLKKSTRQIRVVYPETVPQTFPLPGLLRVDRNSHQAVLTVSAFDESMPATLRGHGAESVEVIDLSLEEIFVETVKGGA